MGRKLFFLHLGPARLYIGATCDSFHIAGYNPSSKRLLKSFDIDFDIGVAI